MKPEYEIYPNGITSYVMYGRSYNITLDENFKGEVCFNRIDPYFNRTAEHFCSHRHTPYDKKKSSPIATVTDSIGYIGFEIFREYAEYGSVHLKYAVLDVIEKLIGDSKTLSTSLPSAGVVSLMKRDTTLVNQIAYVVPKLRGKNTEIIEDIPTVLDTKVTVRADRKPERVYLAPSMEQLDFTYEDGKISYTVPKFECSTLVVIE